MTTSVCRFSARAAACPCFEDGALVGRVPQDGDAGQSRYSLAQQLEPLSSDLGATDGHARDLSSGLGETGDQSGRYRVSPGHHHDRNPARGHSHRFQRLSPPSHDDIGVQPDELGGESGESIDAPLGVSQVEDDRLSRDVAQRGQRCHQRVRSRLRPGVQGAHARGPTARLSRGLDRHGEQTCDRANALSIVSVADSFGPLQRTGRRQLSWRSFGSLYDSTRSQQKGRRDGQAERFRRLEVDSQIVAAGLLPRAG